MIKFCTFFVLGFGLEACVDCLCRILKNWLHFFQYCTESSSSPLHVVLHDTVDAKMDIFMYTTNLCGMQQKIKK